MMDKEGVPSSSGIDIINGETESDESFCTPINPYFCIQFNYLAPL
jgi:hypothetical protein